MTEALQANAIAWRDCAGSRERGWHWGAEDRPGARPSWGILGIRRGKQGARRADSRDEGWGREENFGENRASRVQGQAATY